MNSENKNESVAPVDPKVFIQHYQEGGTSEDIIGNGFKSTEIKPKKKKKRSKTKKKSKKKTEDIISGVSEKSENQTDVLVLSRPEGTDVIFNTYDHAQTRLCVGKIQFP